MKNKFRVSTLVVVLATIACSSCNRGYGCPTNFSINDYVADLIAFSIQLLF